MHTMWVFANLVTLNAYFIITLVETMNDNAMTNVHYIELKI